MGFATVLSRAQWGFAAPQVQVEVQLAPGLPCFNLVGLPAPVVRESRERVRAALGNAGFEFPAGRITVNLAPVELAKEGGRYDLPIALGLLLASGQAAYRGAQPLECYGELGLSGELKPVSGLFLPALQAARAGHLVLVPAGNLAEVRAAGATSVVPVASLLEATRFLAEPTAALAAGAEPATPVPPALAAAPAPGAAPVAFAGIKGHGAIKRALVVAAAGAHSALLCGPPGSGKTLLASEFRWLLPPMGEAEALEVAAVRSLAGESFDPGQWGRRPYRAPHHSASASAILGGGPRLGPGEISLAHRGVLFLDELPEFDRRVLESLREPLESGHITLARAAGRLELPADFLFLAAMNPCFCGHLGDTEEPCRCSPGQIERYRARLSGPLWDRIDLRLEVPRQPAAALLATDDEQRAPGATETEAAAIAPAAQVASARTLQLRRSGCLNARLAGGELEAACRLDRHGSALLERSQQALHLSGRGLHRVLRVARTIADLAGAERVAAPHIAEAVQMRRGMG